MDTDSLCAVAVGFILGLPFIALAIIIRFKKSRKSQSLGKETGIAKRSKPLKQVGPVRAVFNSILATAIVALGGALIGIVTGLVSSFIYIVFLFPLVMGYAGGQVLAGAIRLARIRKTYPLILMSLLAAVAIYGTFHYGKYVSLQIGMSLEMFHGLTPALDDENFPVARAVVDYALQEETGHSGFIGYMLLRANEGISIGRFYSSRRVNLSSALTWLYWILEFGIILGVTFSMGRRLSSKPFCESCGNWYDGEKHLGGTAAANESSVLDLIRQKGFVELGELLEENAEVPSVEMYLEGCRECDKGPSRLIVRRASLDPKGRLQFTDASQTVLPPGEGAQLLDQIKPIRN